MFIGTLLDKVKTALQSQVCDYCEQKTAPGEPFCGRCQETLGIRTPQAVMDIPGFLCHAATTFNPAVKKILYGHKFHARRENTPKLASLLIQYWRNLLPELESGIHPENVLVAAIPPHGNEQSRVSPIAAKFARHFGYDFQPDTLIWAKDVKPQHSIHDKRQRFLNLDRSLDVNHTLITDHARIIIVDDLTTTGATLHEASRAFQGERLRGKRLEVVSLAVTKVPFGQQAQSRLSQYDPD
jgi:predicted amidophosphoribosyltransferase